jgi:hypothetical protein
MSLPADPREWFAALAGVAGAAVGGLLLLRRRLSRDGVEVTKDRAEVDLVATLRAERNAAVTEAKREREQRTADAEKIARLEAQNSDFQSDLRRMWRALPPDKRAILESTDFMPLGPPERRS